MMTMNTMSSGKSVDSYEDEEQLKRSERFKVTRRLTTGAIVALIAWILLLIAFAAPYWLSSYKYTYSDFVRLGLWDFCFRDYRHPSYQYDQKFNGCYWIYSGTYHNVRDWLQPDWFIFVQAMIVLAFIYSLLSLLVLATLIMYYMTRYQVVMMISACALQLATAVFTFVGLLVFGLMAFDRSWLLNPKFNHLDWAYYVAILSLFTHIAAVSLLTMETQEIRLQRKKLDNLSFNMMQPRPMETFDPINNTEERNPIMVQRPQVSSQNVLQPQTIGSPSSSSQPDNGGGGGGGGASILQQFHQQRGNPYASNQPHFTQV